MISQSIGYIYYNFCTNYMGCLSNTKELYRYTFFSNNNTHIITIVECIWKIEWFQEIKWKRKRKKIVAPKTCTWDQLKRRPQTAERYSAPAHSCQSLLNLKLPTFNPLFLVLPCSVFVRTFLKQFIHLYTSVKSRIRRLSRYANFGVSVQSFSTCEPCVITVAALTKCCCVSDLTLTFADVELQRHGGNLMFRLCLKTDHPTQAGPWSRCGLYTSM